MCKRYLKAISALAVAASMLTSCFALTAAAYVSGAEPSQAAAAVPSGETYGDYEYTINDDGETISITGYNGSDTQVDIPSEIDGNSVTTIGSVAFYGCTSLTSINIPDTVTRIEWDAFGACTSLSSINIPDSVTEIGEGAFDGCTSLLSINIPPLVTYIGLSTFYGCTSLTSINIPDLVTHIGDRAFDGCTSLTSINIPDSVTEIGWGAFDDCDSLKSVAIGNSVTEIGDKAFYRLTSLESVTIGDSVTIIGDNAFYDCSSLSSINIPDSVTTIGSSAFDGCSSLSSITIPDSVTEIGESAFSGCKSLSSITIPGSVTKISDNTFSGCSSLLSINIPDSVTEIVDYAFSGCTSLESISVGENNVNYSSLDGVLYNKEKTRLILCPCCSLLTSVTIPDSVTEIGSSAFWGCTSLASVTIPDSVKTIGNSAFHGCTSLTRINVGENNGSYISEDGIIYNKDKTELIACSADKTIVTIPDSVKKIADSAFSGCTSLRITIPDSVTEIGDSVFYYEHYYITIYGKKGSCAEQYANENAISFLNIGILTDTGSDASAYIYKVNDDDDEKTVTIERYTGSDSTVNIPTEIDNYRVTKIGNEAFKYCNSLTSLTIPDSVTTIGWNAFYGCSSLKSVTIGNSVGNSDLWIDSSTFTGCTSLESINVSENNENYSSLDGVLYNKDKTRLILCPCRTSLTSITIPDSVTEISDYALEYCTSLKNVTLGNSLEIIGLRAFAFCSSLTSINIPNSVKIIDISPGTPGNPFLGCTSLTGINVGEKNENYSSIDGVLYNKEKTTLISCPCVKTTVTIPNSVTEIRTQAFAGCSLLTSINIPDSVTQIGDEYDYSPDEVFYGCTSLESINVGENNKNYSSVDGVLYNKDKTKLIACPGAMRSITIPDYVTSIDYDLFNGLTLLESISVGDNNENYSSIDGVLYNKDKTMLIACPGAKTSITIPDSASEEINYYAFEACTSLESITVGENNDNYSSFDGVLYNKDKTILIHCPARKTSVMIPDSVWNINYEAFENCTSLTICGNIGSYAEQYAKQNNITFKALGGSAMATLGDIDGDGDITANDALTILRASVSMESLTQEQTKLSDIDGDEQITANDALMVLRFSVGMADENSPINKPITA